MTGCRNTIIAAAPEMPRCARHKLIAAIAFFIATSLFANAKITVVSIDAPNSGLKDPTPVQPVGGNPGTTLGQQRMIALQDAADMWGNLIDSNVEITIEAKMTSRPCSPTSAVLAKTGPKNVVENFPNAPEANVWYPIALANKLAGSDLDPGNADISAAFNSDLGNGVCFGATGWYYGLDDNHGSRVDMVTVALHEFAHGLGIDGTYDSKTGALYQGNPDVFELHTLDDTLGLRWDQMTDAQRLTSETNDQHLVWDGSTARFGASQILGPTPFLRTGSLTDSIGTADFGSPITVAGLSGSLVAATGDGCTPFPNAASLTGRIALIDRGTCTFVMKAKNAQDAGAIAAIIEDNVAASTPPKLGGSDPSITIPVVSVTRSDGETLRAETPPPFIQLAADPLRLAGTDSNGFVKLFAPGSFEGGSSIHHWDTSVSPDLLMEPSISFSLNHGVDITLDQLIDIGWADPASGRRALRRK